MYNESMTPERWRLVDTVLQAALACEPDRRDAFIVDACGDDEALRLEVISLLAAHDAMTGSFLEQGAVTSLEKSQAPNEQSVAVLANALADRYAIEGEIAHGGM